MRTYNPLFKSTEKTATTELIYENAASYKGVIWKTLLLLFITIAVGVVVSILGFNFNGAGEIGKGSKSISIQPWLLGIISIAGVLGFISILIASLFPKTAIVFSFIYSISQGCILGFITTIVSVILPAAAIISTVSIITIFLSTLLFHIFASFRTKKAILKFLSIVSAAMFFMFIVFLLIRFISPNFFNFVGNESTKLGMGISIGISLFFILYGCLMLLGDFSYAEQIVLNGVDKKYEWSAALGFIFSIIWIYIEIIRLVLIISSLKE